MLWQFVRLLGHEPVEFNQEQARMKSYDGGSSLIRSFPSECLAPLPHSHAHLFTLRP